MSIVHLSTAENAGPSVPLLPTRRPLQRLAEVRQRQGVSRCSAAR